MVRTALLLAATLTTGLVAGLFAAFSYAVMPGLGRADDRTLVIAMQRINESIQNALFFVIFFGALIVTVIAGLLFLGADRKAPLIWIGIGLVLYIATLAITIAGNIPLNNLLDAAGDPDRITDLAALRERYEAPWVRLNNLRTVTSTLAFAALCWASLIAR
jgi:uncharacterized membrane protein